MNKNKFLEMLVDFFYPPACPICGKPRPIKDGVRLLMCPVCKDKISYIEEPRCLKCGKKIQSDETEYCTDCKKQTHFYDRAVSVYEYSDAVKKSIYDFKYHSRREYAKAYAIEMTRQCRDIIKLWNPDIIMPVPIHSSKLKTRGYNQAELIARELGKNLGLDVDAESLSRIRKTIPMKELHHEERIKNLKNAFQVSQNIVKYKKVLIVDDIYTTGATLDACAMCLKESGVGEVYGITLCIGRGF